MRTDSTRVSDQALTEVREFIGDDVRCRLSAGEAEPLPRRRRTRRTRTRRSGRRRCSTIPRRCARYLTQDQVPPLPADLEPLRGVADAAGDVRRNDRRYRPAGRRRISSASRDRCRSSPAGWLSTTRRRPKPARGADGPGPGCDDGGRRRGVRRAAAACRRRSARR